MELPMPMSFPPEISLPPLDVISANALPDLPRKVQSKKLRGPKSRTSINQVKSTESDEFKEVKSEPSAPVEKVDEPSEQLDTEVDVGAFEDGGLPDFCCGVCGKTWRRMNEDLYRNHLEKAHGPFVCLIPGCRKVFAQWGGLYRHKTEVHAKKRSFQCGICKKQFKRRYVCVKHMCSLHGFNANTQRQQILQLILRPEIVSDITSATRMPRMRVPDNYVPPRRFPPSSRQPPKPVVKRRYFAKRTGGRPGKKRKKIQALTSHTISPF